MQESQVIARDSNEESTSEVLSVLDVPKRAPSGGSLGIKRRVNFCQVRFKARRQFRLIQRGTSKRGQFNLQLIVDPIHILSCWFGFSQGGSL